MEECWLSSIGTLQQIKASAKLNYKLAIKHVCFVSENQHNDEMFYHFLNKHMPEFWKCWASKFHRNLDKEVYVNGSNKPADVAEAFASHFSSVYTNSDDATSARSELDDLCRGSSSHELSCDDVVWIVSVHLIDKCIRKLKFGKASDQTR